MNWIEKLERRFGSWAIPKLALYLIIMQAIGYLLLTGGYVGYDDMILHGSSVIHRGQWWRLLSFMMIPENDQLIWLLISFYVFYLISNALEEQWGAFRFNLFILTGYLLTVTFSIISPGAAMTNYYFLGSVLLAFATIFPNFEFLLFFILPVKVKWFGFLAAAFYTLTLFSGDIGSRLSVLAAFITYGLFFGKEFISNFKSGQRKKAYVAKREVLEAQPLHTCESCGKSDKSDPTLSFRYCSTCSKCYCEQHISNHDH